MKTQIYTMQSVEEAQAIVALGVDHVGITPSDCGLPGEVDADTARAIVEAVGDSVVCVAISVESDLDAIEAMVNAVRPHILHLCGLENTLPPGAVGILKNRISNVEIMQAISVAGPEAVAVAHSYEDVVDYIILDTQDPDIDGIGASGETHDWSISRKIVEQLEIPVILAGGLSPENVVEAVTAVQPWGVDSLTHTNHPLPGGGFRKDLDRVRQFIAAVKG